MDTSRQARLNHQLQREIAHILLHELKDPRMGFVTITSVELSSDLSHAKVLYSCLGSAEDRQRSEEALTGAAGFIRSVVKKRLRLRIIPELIFRYDATIAQSIELSAKLDDLKRRTP